MGRYGSRADEAETSSGGDGDVWIVGLKPGNTRVRFVQPTGTFHKWREHYEQGVKAFMCDDSSECPGCNDADEEVQRRSRKFGFNALEQSGRLRVIKIGPKFYEKLTRKEKWHDGTLMDRDWILIRTGERLETDYDAEAGEKYEVALPSEIYNIENILGAQYWEARRAYGLSVDEKELERCKLELMMDPFDIVAPVVEETDTKQWVAEGVMETAANINDPKLWKTDQLREYLQQNNVDSPDKAPRSRLLSLVDEHIKANEQPPF